jgi:hypothetical protein
METQAPPFRPSKSVPVHLIVPLFVLAEFPILMAPFTSSISWGVV